MDTSNHVGEQLPFGQFVCHPYLRGRSRAAHQAFLLAFYTELNEYNWDDPDHGWDDGVSDAFSPSELAEAFSKGNRAYESALLRSGRVW